MSTDDWFNVFATLTVLTNVAIVAIVALALAARFSRGAARDAFDELRTSLASSGLPIAALVTGTAMAGSLYLSEGADLVPCVLCWYQRIAMYALAVVLLVAAVRRDWAIRPYAIVLAGLGLVVSTYHYLIQRFPELESSATCDPFNPCVLTLVWKLHYISIPFMAGSGFLLTLLLLLVARPLPPDDGDDAAARDDEDAAPVHR